VRITIENGAVLTMNPRDDLLDPGWIEIVDGEITQVSNAPIDVHGADRRIDAADKVVMPGLINAHTHLFQTLIRGVYEHLPFTDWLRQIYHCGRVLTAEDCYIGAMLGSLESLKCGVTTLVDHHFLNRGTELPQATIAGMQAIGLRTVLARTIMDLGEPAPAEVLETAEQGLRSVEELLAHYRGQTGEMLTLMTGPNTPGVSSSGELAQATRRFADEHGLRVSAHIAESASVLTAVEQRYGRHGVVAWLDELGALGPTTIAAHAVHLSPDEIKILAARGVSVAHNPVSNMFLGDGIAPVVEMLGAGVTVALGTDGAASNNSQDMFEVTRVASLLQRARLQDPKAVSPIQALRMATINGARALGLDHLVGSIEPGKRADFITLDLYRSPHNVAVHNIVSHLVHCARASDVDFVMVDGRVLMEDRQVAGLDEFELLNTAQQIGRHLVERLG
jgi:5-methylthioadenosine/S-adenosylhomocysteine deaminase